MTRPARVRLAVAVVIATCGAGLGACGDGSDDDAARSPPDASDDRDPTAPDATVDAAPVRAEFGLDVRPKNTTCKAPARPPNGATVKMDRVFANVTFPALPVSLRQPPGDRSRWFAALRDGRIASFSAVNPPNEATVVADLAALSGMPVNALGEGGLLGMAFHPKFAQNGQLFASWTTTGPNTSGMRSIVSRITTTNGGATFGQHTAVLGPFDQPYDIHKGGDVRFGPDGLLYLSFGDGGDADVQGQSKTGFLSKILRIDVDAPSGGKAYGIPAGNPFANGGGEPATFARGFRNPFRFSVDRDTGDVWVGDVGEGSWEEIDLVKAGGNHGWPCREGAQELNPAACSATEGLVDPVHAYPHPTSTAVTGGVVYRGSAIPGLAGTYVFGDSYTFDLVALTQDPLTGVTKATTLNTDGVRDAWIDFTEDADGELYALGYGTAAVYKLVAAAPTPTSSFPDRLSKTGCVDANDPKRPAPGLVPYDLESPFWSDGADKQRFLAVPDDKTITVNGDGDFDLPIGSVVVKTFTLGGKRIETRLLVRHEDGEWAGYSYEWNDAPTDAVLLPASKSKKVGAQTWSFPGRGQCAQCHTAAAGRTLGLELGQLNGDLVYTETNRISNQLRTLDHIGMFAAPLGSIEQLPAYPRPAAPGALEARARSYLHANCSHCHRPNGPGRGDLDLRFATPLAATKVCGTAPALGDLGVAGAKVVAPGSPATSVLSLRTRAVGAARMPPLASNVVDTVGAAVVDDWITSLTACP